VAVEQPVPRTQVRIGLHNVDVARHPSCYDVSPLKIPTMRTSRADE